MKVMHVIHGLNTGGAETLVKEYVLGFNKDKFDVTLLCFEHIKESPYEKILKKNNIKVIYISDYMKYNNKKGILYKIINHFQKFILVKRIIRNENPEILHTHLPINRYIKFAKPKKKTKIFHTVHSAPKALWDFEIKARKKDFYAAKWLREKYNMTFICLHDEMKNEVNTMFNTNTSLVLNNGIDFSRFENAISKEEIRKKINIPNNAFVIGHVGRFSRVKNHTFIVDVFKEIYNKNRNSFLLLIGTGEEKEKIINKLNELKLNNNYLILENRTDIPDLLNAMDIFIFPSIYEGLGIALIEAQKMKLPCFISEGVPDGAIISNLVTKLSLDLPEHIWASKIIYYQKPKLVNLNDENWNIKKVINKLENIYLEGIK